MHDPTHEHSQGGRNNSLSLFPFLDRLPCFVIQFCLLASDPRQFCELNWGGHQQPYGWVSSCIHIHFMWKNSLCFIRSPKVKQPITLRTVYTWAHSQQPPPPPNPKDYFFCCVHRWVSNKISNEILPLNPFSLVNSLGESAGLRRAHVACVFLLLLKFYHRPALPFHLQPPTQRQLAINLSFPVSLRNLLTMSGLSPHSLRPPFPLPLPQASSNTNI